MVQAKALSGASDYTKAVQDRVRFLVEQIAHAAKNKAKVRLERRKNELRSLVALYGMQIMQEVFKERGFEYNPKQ